MKRLKYLLIILFAFLAVCCKTKSFVETEKIVYHHDTVIVNTYITDTLIEEIRTVVHDSIHIVCDTTGNVIYKEVFKYIEKDTNKEEKSFNNNSEIVVRNDSIVNIENKEIVKEKKDYRTIINLVILLIIVFLVYKAIRLIFSK